MGDVYTAHVHYTLSGSDLPDPAGFAAESEAPELAVGFTARDETGGNQAWFALIVRSHWNAGAWETRTECRWSATGFAASDFANSGTVLNTQDVADDAEALYDGGRLTIEKDQDGDAIRFTWPGGSYQTTLSSLSMQNANGMYSEVLEAHQRYRTTAVPALDNTYHWKAFWTEKNAVRVRGAALSSVQPGSWAAVNWTAQDNSAGVTAVHTQAAQEDQLRLHSAVDTTLARAYYRRNWNGGNTIPKFARELDMTEAPEHGIVWRVFSLSATPETLYWERTHDHGQTWTRGVVHEGQTTADNPEPTVYTPNIAWYNGVLLAVWHDGQDVVQRVSYDMGEHWEALTLILAGVTGLTQVVPRVVVHPDHGLTYYFYVVSETGQLEVGRSGDFGANVTVIAVTPGVFTTWLDAWIEADGFIRAAFEQVTGSAAFASADIGERWDADVEFPTGTRRQRSRYDRKLGLSYHTYWESAGSRVLAYASPNHGALSTPTLAATQVAAGLPEQTPAVAVLNNGGAMVSYVDTDENLLEKTTVDFGVSWDTA